MSEYHIPVLLQESIDALITDPDGIYADATFGGGGHSAEILRRLGEDGRLIAFDRDADAIANNPLKDDPRLILEQADFRFIHNFVKLELHKMGRGGGLSGIIADLGVSSHQFDTAERGFSFRYDAPLDMRMNTRAELSAKQVVNNYDEKSLERMFRLYGEVDNARRLAQLIVSSRSLAPIETTGQLDEAIKAATPAFAGHKYLAKVYQALRIEVNKELKSLEKFLYAAAESLEEGGRLVVITYHSLEDRMVKNFIRSGNVEGNEDKDIFGNRKAPLRAVNRKPILPQETEIGENTRARSAKLRIAELARTPEKQ